MTTMAATTGTQQAQLELFEGFPVRIEVFEGPLDLLLHLVRRQEVEIADVQVSAITDEYLRYLETMVVLNMDLAGEFIVMAANLLWLKSRVLLPRQTDEVDEALVEDELVQTEAELRQRLEEYRSYKEAAELLSESREMRRRVFLRALSDGDEIGSGYVPLEDVSLFDMVGALQEMLDRTKSEAPQIVRTSEITVPDCIDNILLRLSSAPERCCNFVELVETPTTRIVIVLVFLATLELIRRRRIRVLRGTEARQIVITLVD